MPYDSTQPPNRPPFYLLNDRARSTPAGKEFLNMSEVCAGTGVIILCPRSSWERGFRSYAARPRFRISRRLGRTVPDVESYLGYWFISDAAKRVLDAVSPQDFCYLPVEVDVDRGCEPRTCWLCDVVTMLDAVDETRSGGLRVTFNDQGRKLHNTLCASTAFDENIVGEHHVFRLLTDPNQIICTERFKSAYKAAKLSGQSFLPAYEPPFETIGVITEIWRNNSGGWRSGQITPDKRGAQIIFGPEAVDDPDETPEIGQTVHVRGHRNKWGRRSAERVTRT